VRHRGDGASGEGGAPEAGGAACCAASGARARAWAGAYASQSARARGRREAGTRVGVCASSVSGGWHGGSGRSARGRPSCAGGTAGDVARGARTGRARVAGHGARVRARGEGGGRCLARRGAARGTRAGAK
jgi:hypothetical protein